MGFSVISDNIKIVVNTDAGAEKAARTPVTYRSALQNPEISRIQLAALLRRKLRNPPKSAQNGKNFWNRFMAGYKSAHANTNAAQ